MSDEHNYEHDGKYAVVDRHGAGWGRFHTLDEAVARADGLEAMDGTEYTVTKAITSSTS